MRIKDVKKQVLDHNPIIRSIIEEISSRPDQEEAFYVCNLDEVIEKHKTWTSELPRVEPHYAVKCNDDITILKVLAALGASFDCASTGEINKVLSVGVDPERIIFANPTKPISHIRYAASAGIATMTFDNESELYKIQSIYPDARLIIRIRVDATDAYVPLGMKFGCDSVKEAPKLLQVAKALNLNVVGVSFHVGSGCREPAAFRRAISASKDIFTYAKTLGFTFSVLDIGGGYPGERGSSISEIATVVNEALDHFFNDTNVRIISEPGTFYVASAYTLTCNIHSIRKVCHEDDQGNSFETHRMYYINDGVYGSFNCVLSVHQVMTPKLLKQNPGTNRISSSIWGPTLDSVDRVIEDVPLPELSIGDWIVFEDMGAYTLALASKFNGLPIPKVIHVMSQNMWSIFNDAVALTEDVRVVAGQIAERNDIYHLKKPSLINFMGASKNGVVSC